MKVYGDLSKVFSTVVFGSSDYNDSKRCPLIRIMRDSRHYVFLIVDKSLATKLLV